MITEIILAIMALLFLMVGIFLFKGKAAWLIAGYNSLSEEEKKKYDKKAICKATSFICFVLLRDTLCHYIYSSQSQFRHDR